MASHNPKSQTCIIALMAALAGVLSGSTFVAICKRISRPLRRVGNLSSCCIRLGRVSTHWWAKGSQWPTSLCKSEAGTQA